VPRGFNSLPSAILGVGYPTIDAALYGRLALGLLLLFLIAKMVAVSLTIGSGGSGGVFAPALFVGAMLGGAFGEIGHLLVPSFIGANVSDYAIAGMAAVFAGTAQAPVTAIMILFELTSDYKIILPLMLAVVTATVVAHAVSNQTIYTMKLFRRGVDLVAGRSISVMNRLKVKDAMIPDRHAVDPGTSISQLVDLMHSAHQLSFPVVDSNGCFHGMVRAEDIEEQLLTQSGGNDHTVGEIVQRAPVVFPDESLETALERFSIRDQRRVPVVDRADPDRLLGILQAWDVLSAYRTEVLRAEENLSRTPNSAGVRARLGPLAAFTMRRPGGTAQTKKPPVTENISRNSQS
jgi:chloride channel protein, CIC family